MVPGLIWYLSLLLLLLRSGDKLVRPLLILPKGSGDGLLLPTALFPLGKGKEDFLMFGCGKPTLVGDLGCRFL